MGEGHVRAAGGFDRARADGRAGKAARLVPAPRATTPAWRSRAAPAALTWLRPARVSGAEVLAGASVSHRAWIAVRANGVATVLGLGVEIGALSEGDVRASLGGNDAVAIYRLTEKAMEGVCAWMTRLTLEAQGGTYVPCNRFAWMDLTPSEEPHATDLHFFGNAIADVELDLNALPPPLAALFHDVVQLSSGLAEAFMPENYLEYAYWVEERMNDLERLEKAGLLNDPAKAHEYVEGTQEFETLNGYSREDFTEIVERCRQWLAPIPAWRKPRGRHTKHPARAMVRAFWRLRREHPALYRHPATRIARRMASTARRYEREARKHGHVAYGQMYENEMPLGIMQGVFLGFAWEQEAVDWVRENIMQSGEELSLRITLSRVMPQALRARLTAMARMQGLLIRAGEMLKPKTEETKS